MGSHQAPSLWRGFVLRERLLSSESGHSGVGLKRLLSAERGHSAKSFELVLSVRNYLFLLSGKSEFYTKLIIPFYKGLGNYAAEEFFSGPFLEPLAQIDSELIYINIG